jgi:hypothetical protein
MTKDEAGMTKKVIFRRPLKNPRSRPRETFIFLIDFEETIENKNYYTAPLMMPTKSSTLRLAPPTRAPSIFSLANSSLLLLALTLPP